MRASLLVLLSLLAACGSGPAPQAEHRPPPDARPGEGRFSGRLDATDIQRVISQHRAGFNNCLAQAEASYLSGDVLVELTVDQTGRVKQASVARSDLGKWQVEDCLIETAAFLSFPRPEGGDARFAYTFPGPSVGQRLVRTAEPAWGYPTLRGARKAINDCRRRYDYSGPFHVTAYVGPLGEVLDAGFDAKLAPRRELPACVVGVVRGLRFPAGRGITKYRTLVENLGDDA